MNWFSGTELKMLYYLEWDGVCKRDIKYFVTDPLFL